MPAIKVKKGGVYADPVGIFAKKAGVYSAVTGVSAKVAGAYALASASPLSAPSGFNYTPPFSVLKGGSAYSTSFSMDAVKPTPTVTLYCGKGGDNANNGTTWALRVRSLKQLVARIQAQAGSAVVRCIIEAATYRYTDVDGGSIQDSFAGAFAERSVIVESCDSSGNVLVGGSEVSRRIISLHNETMPSWTLVSGSVFVSDYSTEVVSPGCFDLANLNAKSKPQALRYAPPATTYANEAAIVAGVAAKAAEFGQGACFVDTTNTKYYVQTFNGRAPDSSIVVLRGGFQSNGANARNLYLIGQFGATQTVWARDLHLWGGAPAYAATQWSGEGRNINAYFADCSFSYGGINGFNADGAGVFTLLRCDASDNYKDGFNYDQAAGFDAGGTAVMRFHEIDCTADWNGNSSQSDDSDNASSAHVRTVGVRVNTIANRTLNRAFHDIAASRTWNLGCQAINCRQTGVQSGAFVAGFPSTPGETGKVWLDGCVSDTNAYDLEAYRGATLYYANMNVTGYVNEALNGGVITTYNSPPVLPGATGTLSAAALTSSTVQLTFTNASGAASHEYRVNGGAATALAGDKIVTGLTQLTAYTFEVRGVNADGNGAWSNVANATTPASAVPADILAGAGAFAATGSWTGTGFNGKSISGGTLNFAATPAFDGVGIVCAVAPIPGKYYEIGLASLTGISGSFRFDLLGGTTRSSSVFSTNGAKTERVLANTGNTQLYILPTTTFSGVLDGLTLVGPHDTP